ncbi:hypothetical protein GCM10020331_076990 [Ectobacillus funiculus]
MKKKQRIVVKIGSSSLTSDGGGICIEKKLTDHVDALAKLKQAGHEVVLISSGAVAAGFTELGYPSRPVTITGKQAAAAVGQGLLMQAYTEAFREHHIVAAQLLLTRGDFFQGKSNIATPSQPYRSCLTALCSRLLTKMILFLSRS